LIDQATFDAVQAHLHARNPKVTPARVISGPAILTGIFFRAARGGAIESGVADLDDPAPNERMAGLKSTRDQAQAGAERTADALDSAGQPTITSAMVRKFAATARERLRITGGGIFARSRNASRSQTARSEIMGSKSDLLKTLAAASGAQPATFGVRSSVPKWRPQGCSHIYEKSIQ
jgi:site-specific DNA recombinase